MRGKAGSTPVCSVDGCETLSHSRGWCQKHYKRWVARGNPEGLPSEEEVREHNRKASLARWADPQAAALQAAFSQRERKGDEIGYTGAHARVRKAWGSPEEHQCLMCGGQAQHWAFTHNSERMRYSPEGKPYSPDINDYVPLCVSCHHDVDGIGRNVV